MSSGRAILWVLLAFCVCQPAHAIFNHHINCPGISTSAAPAYPGWFYFTSAGSCGSITLPGKAVAGFRCLSAAIGGMQVNSINYNCTNSATDGATAVTSQDFYVNAVEMPSRSYNAGAWIDSTQVWLVFMAPTSGTGCSPSGFPSAGSQACAAADLVACQAGGVTYTCSLSLIREPDMIGLQNVIVVVILALVFLFAVAFGWKLAHGSNQQ